MKKILTVLILLLITAYMFAADYTPAVPSITPTRYDAIGGYHVTDDTDYFTIFANPAAVPLANGKASWFFIDVNLGGPLEEGLKAFEILSNENNNSNAQAELSELVGDAGINGGLEVIGPLTLGGIYKLPYGSLGWGLFNQTRLDFVLPTVSSMNLIVGEDLLLQFTYGAPIIQNDNHYLSAGISVKGFGVFEGLYAGSPLSLTINTDASQVLDTIPVYAAGGIAFDLGIYYKFIDMLSAGLVWRDVASPTWVQSYTVDTIQDFGSESSELRLAQSSLDVGIGVDIPVGKASSVITNFVAMLDFKDILALSTPLGQNQILNLAFGTELTLFDMVSFRLGISDMYLNTGVGVQLGVFSLNAAVYGRELGLDPGSIPQMNMAFSMGFVY